MNSVILCPQVSEAGWYSEFWVFHAETQGGQGSEYQPWWWEMWQTVPSSAGRWFRGHLHFQSWFVQTVELVLSISLDSWSSVAQLLLGLYSRTRYWKRTVYLGVWALRLSSRSYSTSCVISITWLNLCPSFHICKIQVIIVPTSLGWRILTCEDQVRAQFKQSSESKA